MLRPSALARGPMLRSWVSTQVGPGNTELTVTFEPLVVSANPRAMANCAALEKP